MLTALYSNRNYAPLWTRDGAPTPAAIALVGQLATAHSRGLEPEDYGASRLTALARPGGGSAPEAADRGVRFDVALSLYAARFVKELHAGRVDPRAIGFRIDTARPPLDPALVLQSLAIAPTAEATVAILDSLEPRWLRYSLLKEALARYRKLAADPGLTAPLPRLPKRSLAAGARYAGAPQLRRLLIALGDLPESRSVSADEELIDEALSAAIARFQGRHGLKRDGVLGERTFRALSVPLAARARQIELALERFRWLPPKLENPPIFVNIPQFKLFAFHTTEDREETILPIDVIVGSVFPRHNTPVFAADMEYVVFRPFWDVPTSILRNELLPQIRARPAAMANQGYEAVRRDGRVEREFTPEVILALESGAARLRQRPGPRNALGRIKFVFPNDFAVYLHDTPAVSLFNEPVRAYSHGCIRVADPVALAEYVLRANPGWTREKILEAMEQGDSRRVNLAQPIRVFIVYATALAAEDGSVLFFEDIYGHDARLEAALRARTAQRPAAAGGSLDR